MGTDGHAPLAALAERIDDGRDLLAELVDLDTPSLAPDAIAAGLGILERELSSRGFSTGTRAGRQGVPVLVANRGRGRPTALVGHVDTVFGHGEAAARPFRVDASGVARGPGAADMKAGLVALLRCIDLLDAASVDPPLRVVVNGDEEQGSVTSREVLREELADAARALVFEPSCSGERLVVRRRGILRGRLTVAGVAAHSGTEPRAGVNAIHDLAERVQRLTELGAQHPDSDLSVTLIEGGHQPSTVPAHAACTVDVRTATPADERALKTGIEEICAAETAAGARSEIEWRPTRRPVTPGEGLADLRTAFEEAGEALGAPVEMVACGGASDASILAELGVAVVDGCGPAGGAFHRRDEHVELASIPRRAALCAGAIARLHDISL